jgi:ubiquitin thioesterase protein OTUB1
MESFGSLIKDRAVLLEENENLKINIDKLNQIISDIISRLNKVRENFLIYYEIHKNIICNNNKFRNFEILYNINEFSNNIIKKDIEKIIRDNNINNQITNLMNIYQKMETEQKNLEKEDKILLFDPDEEKEESSFNILDHSEFNNNNNLSSQNKNKNEENNNPSSQNINKNEENNNLSKSENKIVVKKEEENEEALEKKRSATIEIVSELKNILLEEVINKVPLISELLDINELLKNYKEDSPELNIVKLITTKYTKFRQVRQNGNSFYTCFLYRLFEFISLNKEKTLYDKIFKKIVDAKTLITKNGYDWDFLKDSYNLFKVEFNSCFEQSLISLKSSRQYLDELFKSDERMNYLNHFIHFCVAAYIKENKILYENYISDDFEKWILKVEEVGLECCQLEILACVNYFDIGVKIEYLYPSKLDVVKYPENKKGDEIFINMLFRPDHYDVLYK